MGDGTPPSPTKSHWSWLAHPLLLLLVGALVTAGITGLVVPSITRGWQNHDTALKIRSDLVARMGTSVSAFLAAAEADAVSTANDRQKDLDRAYREWEVDSAEIDSQMLAYFPRAEADAGNRWPEAHCLGKRPESTITADESWREYACAIAGVYYLFSAPASRYGKQDTWLRRLTAYLRVPRKNVDGVLDSPRTGAGINATYVSAMRELFRKLRLREGEISQLILAAPSAL